VKSQSSGFLDRTATLEAHEYRYRVFVPRGYTAGRAWPLILFLHGAGERGEDGDLPTQVGLGAAIRRHEGLFPAVAVFPQLPAGENWRTAAMQRLALLTLECAREEFRARGRSGTLHGIPGRRARHLGSGLRRRGVLHLAFRAKAQTALKPRMATRDETT